MYRNMPLIWLLWLFCIAQTPPQKKPASFDEMFSNCLEFLWGNLQCVEEKQFYSNTSKPSLISVSVRWRLWPLTSLSSLSLSWGCSCDGETARGVDRTHGGHAEDSTGRGMAWTNPWVQNQLIPVWAELLSTTAGWQWKEANSTFWEIRKFAFLLRGRWKDCLYGVTA